MYVPLDETVITYALADPGGAIYPFIPSLFTRFDSKSAFLLAGLRPGAVREDLSGAPAPDYNYPNTHGFVYQAEAIHRCLAVGLLQCPQVSFIQK